MTSFSKRPPVGPTVLEAGVSTKRYPQVGFLAVSLGGGRAGGAFDEVEPA